jgi:hypothetical protein
VSQVREGGQRGLLDVALPKVGASIRGAPIAFPARAIAMLGCLAVSAPDLSRERAARILRASLTEPATLVPSDLDGLAGALRLAPEQETRCAMALAALAALLYARPDLVHDAHVDAVADLLTADPVPGAIGEAAAKFWECLAAGRLAPRAWSVLTARLRDGHLAPEPRARLVTLVGAFAQWREDLVGLEGILTLAEAPGLIDHRAFLLDHGVERFVFCAPEDFTIERLECIAALFRHLPRYRYSLYSLAGRPVLADVVRTWLARELAGRFPHHEAAAAILTGRPVRLLVVLNVGMGQGDDVVRLVPLLQALLDANPALTVTLVTRRPYLYDHPRVTTIAIRDDATVHATLDEPFDGVIEFFQPEWLDFTFRLDVHAALERVVAVRAPAFVVMGDLGRACEGRAGGRSAFLHQRVELAGRDVARTSGLDQIGLRNIYDPTLRLLAELGLPQRAAEEAPRAPSLLTGTRSVDAERVWAEIVAQDSTVLRRPVALVNPFGGSGRTKGFLDQDALLAADSPDSSTKGISWSS